MGVNKTTNYYIGLDIGMDSAGYAVTTPQYDLLQHRGEPMWGVSVFGQAETAAERRMFRSNRRNLYRKKWRRHLLQGFFAGEISKIDPEFFIRLQESALHREDKTRNTDPYSLFNNPGFTDQEYHQRYPTIHHLIWELMQNPEPHDARLVYLACAWILEHRGHFLDSIDTNDLSAATDFLFIHRAFLNGFVQSGYDTPWSEDMGKEIAAILQKRESILAKEKEFFKLLNNGKKIKNNPTEAFPFGKAAIIRLLCGGKIAPDVLFQNELYEDLDSISFEEDDEILEGKIGQLDSPDVEVILQIRKLYNWGILASILKTESNGTVVNPNVSEIKIRDYEQHRKDLKELKYFISKYCPEQYKTVFQTLEPKLPNYAAYSYHFKTGDAPAKELPDKKASQQDFCDFLKPIMKKIQPETQDRERFDDLLNRIEAGIFAPKQRRTENRVIPQQLYQAELRCILKNASGYLPFLTEKDEDGLSVSEKILSIFRFCIPYFVGPLNTASPFAWLKRKQGTIYPWNFSKMVDLDQSEQAFIGRMTNTCSYLPSEPVLPKQSLQYSFFMLLDELNNLRINGKKISVEAKQAIVQKLFMTKRKVTVKQIHSFLIKNGYAPNDSTISGLDNPIHSSLDSYIDFSDLLSSGQLTEKQAEEIIARATYISDTARRRQWLDSTMGHLPEPERKRISMLKYKDFGRLSSKFLTGMVGANKSTGEAGTVLELLWNTNHNLIQLLSESYTFAETIASNEKEFYQDTPMSLDERLQKMSLSSQEKRPVIRTLRIVEDVVKATGKAPEKIFVNSVRQSFGKNKGKRSVSRKDQILNLYKQFPATEVAELRAQLENMGDDANNNLQNDALYLYFMQLGRCMYTGEKILFSRLSADYNKEHIYPRRVVLDNSVHNNLVLTKISINKAKDDSYPISPVIQKQMSGFWNMLLDKQMITAEKYKRLTRATEFSDDEKFGFTQQLIGASGQMAKAIRVCLQERYPDTQVVFAREDLISEFRGLYGLSTVRSLGEMYRAKNAYLNAVAGNIYHDVISKPFYLTEEKYSMNPRTIYERKQVVNGKTTWDPDYIEKIKNTLQNPYIHIALRPHKRTGAFYKTMPLKAGEKRGMAERKMGLDVKKYGGYPDKATSFFLLARYRTPKKLDAAFIPVTILDSNRVLRQDDFAQQYVENFILETFHENCQFIDFPLGKQAILMNTILRLNKFDVCISGKTGVTISAIPMTPLYLRGNEESYVRRLERVWRKQSQEPKYKINEVFDRITSKGNLEIYDFFLGKSGKKPFVSMPAPQTATLEQGRETFIQLSLEEQVRSLKWIVDLFRCNRTDACDLSLIGGSKNAGKCTVSMKLSTLKKYDDVRIITTSASGLIQKKSDNLLKLIDESNLEEKVFPQ